MKIQTNTRNSNIELARIVAMAAIVICHFVCHGVFKDCWPLNWTLLLYLQYTTMVLSAYLWMLLLSPIINAGIDALSKNDIKNKIIY